MGCHDVTKKEAVVASADNDNDTPDTTSRPTPPPRRKILRKSTTNSWLRVCKCRRRLDFSKMVVSKINNK